MFLLLYWQKKPFNFVIRHGNTSGSSTYILYISQNIKLTLKARIYPLAQLLNNTHDLELQHKMKMPRLNSWSHLFASWKK